MASFEPPRSATGTSYSGSHPADNGTRQQSQPMNIHQQTAPSFPPPPRDPPSTKPIADAVNSAFDNSSAANALPPDVISKITEQVRAEVIHSLRSELGAQGMPYQVPPFPSSPPTGNQIPMPSASAFTSQPGGHQSFQQPLSMSAGGYSSSPTAGFERRDDLGYAYHENERSNSAAQSQPRDIPIRSGNLNSQFSPSQSGNLNPHFTPTHSGTSPQFSTAPHNKEDLAFRYGDRDRNVSPNRPQPNRVMTDDEETVVEKMWQPLFDSNNRATPRLRQFLRGVALHMIEDFEPKHSLVVGPKKMRKFYEMMKAPEEVFPWNSIFNLPPNQLSVLYSTLSCQHHLVPPSKSPYDSPSLAALTPHGFADWMIQFILASPSTEFDRLAKTVRDWPISNADERKERFPKELSRRLFPKAGRDSVRREIDDALVKVGVQKSPTFPPPPTREMFSSANSNATTSLRATDPATSNSARHQSHTYVSSANTTDDEVDKPSRNTSIPIERERKPYVAREGTGKIYNDSGSAINVNNSAANMSRTKSRESEHSYASVPPPPPRRERAGSNATSNDGSTVARRSSVYGGSNTSYSHERDVSREGRNGYLRDANELRDYSRDRDQPHHHHHHLHHSVVPPPPPQQPPTHHYSSGDEDPRGYYTSPDRSRHLSTGMPIADPVAERRYAAYGEEYEREKEGRGGAWGGPPGAYTGFGSGMGMGANPPLGTGERRY